MKKRYLILIIATILLLTLGFSDNIFADNSNLIHGVEPTKVTSHFIGKTEFGPFDWYFEFWNVGALGGGQYSKATAKYTQSSDKDILRSGTYEGTFTGGPNGTLTFKTIEGYGSGEMVLKLQDGRYIDCGEFGTADIDNPEAFDGWMDQELAGTAPTIELLIIEGPVALEGGELRWTVKAIATGDPEPTVEFSCNPSEGMGTTENENIVIITVPKDKIYELTATADNMNLKGYATAVLTFVNEDSGAKFSDIAGQVEIRPHNDIEAWSYAKLDSKLYVDMHIKTFDNSSAILSFPDATTFHLKSNTEIVLSSAHGEKVSHLKLLWGNLMINWKKMLKDGSMTVEMSQAAASIKGTKLILSETGTESSIKVIEGTVEFKLLNSNQSVEVSKSESETASKDGFSEKTTFDTVEEEKSWEMMAEKTIDPVSNTQEDTKSISKKQNSSSGIIQNIETNLNKSGIPSWFIIIISIMVLLLLAVLAILVIVFLRTRK